jgi:deoxyribodipyrimidine photo-lyase
VFLKRAKYSKDDGKPYTIFTPYSRKWKQKLDDFYLSSYPCKKYYKNFSKQKSKEIASLKEIGFEETDTKVEPPTPSEGSNSTLQRNPRFPFCGRHFTAEHAFAFWYN